MHAAMIYARIHDCDMLYEVYYLKFSSNIIMTQENTALLNN